jgi:hypothetical protein
LPDLTTGFFPALADRDLVLGFAWLDDTGDTLEQPGRFRIPNGARPELFDQHHLATIWIIRQYRHDRSTLKNFTRKYIAVTTAKQLMREAVLFQFKVLAKQDLVLIELP